MKMARMPTAVEARVEEVRGRMITGGMPCFEDANVSPLAIPCNG